MDRRIDLTEDRDFREDPTISRGLELLKDDEDRPYSNISVTGQTTGSAVITSWMGGESTTQWVTTNGTYTTGMNDSNFIIVIDKDHCSYCHKDISKVPWENEHGVCDECAEKRDSDASRIPNDWSE